MRLGDPFVGVSHDALAIGAHDHHPQPRHVSISNTSQVIAGGAAFNLDLSLGRSGYTFARVMITGPKSSGFSSAQWRECADVHVTATLADAIGHSVRDSGSTYKVYGVTYAKAVGATNLTHKVFDSNTGGSNRYIALKDAQIIGSTLRLTFHNYDAGPQTLWVKGEAVIW